MIFRFFRATLIGILLVLGACSGETATSISPISPTPGAVPKVGEPILSSESEIEWPTSLWTSLGNNGVAQIDYQLTKKHLPQHWVRIMFDQPLPTGERYQVMLQFPDCRQQNYRTIYLIRASSTGKVLSSGVPIDTEKVVQVEANSAAATAYAIACANSER